MKTRPKSHGASEPKVCNALMIIMEAEGRWWTPGGGEEGSSASLSAYDNIIMKLLRLVFQLSCFVWFMCNCTRQITATHTHTHTQSHKQIYTPPKAHTNTHTRTHRQAMA